MARISKEQRLADIHQRALRQFNDIQSALRDERLFRFEFPERPGALLRFLEAVGSRWNITLFHYRNHGSDAGRVVAGIQVSTASHGEFLQHLAELHYPWIDESANPAYRIFLGN